MGVQAHAYHKCGHLIKVSGQLIITGASTAGMGVPKSKRYLTLACVGDGSTAICALIQVPGHFTRAGHFHLHSQAATPFPASQLTRLRHLLRRQSAGSHKMPARWKLAGCFCVPLFVESTWTRGAYSDIVHALCRQTRYLYYLD